jgi:hypothetical protein
MPGAFLAGSRRSGDLIFDRRHNAENKLVIRAHIHARSRILTEALSTSRPSQCGLFHRCGGKSDRLFIAPAALPIVVESVQIMQFRAM